MDRWNKTGFGEIRDTKLKRKNAQMSRKDRGVNGGKNWVVMPMKKKKKKKQLF